MRSSVLLSLAAVLPACALQPTPDTATKLHSPGGSEASRAEPLVEHWGAMREVLRDGHTQGRVDLAEVLGPHTVAVGASAGLAAEITVVGGTAHLAEVVDAASPPSLSVRAPTAEEQATLLVLANVAEWSEHPLGSVTDLAALEASVQALAAASGIDVAEPFPFRVEGVASTIRLHVLNHSCPIADPHGPQPFRYAGEDEATVLVGFHAEDSAGLLTHHGQKTHTHAVLRERNVSGHLDGVTLEPGATLYLPAR